MKEGKEEEGTMNGQPWHDHIREVIRTPWTACDHALSSVLAKKPWPCRLQEPRDHTDLAAFRTKVAAWVHKITIFGE